MSAQAEKFKFTEFLDLVDKQEKIFEVKDFKTGFYEFAINGDPRQGIKKVDGVRLFYVKPPGEPGVDYVDIGQQTLVAQISPHLPSWRNNKQRIKIKAFGVGVLKRFTVETV